MNRNSKNVVRLTESELREMIKESVANILNEGFADNVKGMWQGAKNGLGNNRLVNTMRKDGYNAINGYSNLALQYARQITDFCKNKQLDTSKFMQYLNKFVNDENGVSYDKTQYNLDTMPDHRNQF